MVQSSLFCFACKATYEIVIFGRCSISRLKETLSLDIEELKNENGFHTIRIRKVMRDQAALSGFLNTIYELHLTILSVKLIEVEENNTV